MRNATNIEFVRSKACRDCSDRIYYSLQDKQWCSDSDLKIRHKCANWKPKPDQDDAILNKVTLLEHKSEKSFLTISEIRLKVQDLLTLKEDIDKLRKAHHENTMKLDKIISLLSDPHRFDLGDHE